MGRVRRKGRCVEFDGVNDYGTAGNLILAQGDWTFMAWVKTTKAVGDNEVVCLVDTIYAQCMRIRNGYFYPYVRDENLNTISLLGSENVADGVWHHLSVSIDYDGKATSYVDGVIDAEVNSTLTGDMPSGTLGVGKNSIDYLDGSVRDARVYNTAKTQVEIVAIMACDGSNPDLVGCVSKWTCNEETGLIAYDSSGNGNHITWSGIDQGTFHAVDSSITVNPANVVGYSVGDDDEIVPAVNDTTDALGNPLTYTGPFRNSKAKHYYAHRRAGL